MSDVVERRTFLRTAAAAGVGLGLAGRADALWAAPLTGAGAPSDRVRVAVMGTNSRGAQLAKVVASLPNAQVTHICDVEEGAAAKGVKAANNPQVKVVKDLRRVLDENDVDALVIAAPDHWHAPAAILATAAGKHVYVEKPCSQNPREGEWLVAAAKKHQRIVQMGNQRRSWPNLMTMLKELQAGTVIGRVYYAKGWYDNARQPIGVGKPAPVPANLDFELWQGPAPRRPYKDNLVHYNWHWFWHWGTGEACNNGTHEIDVMRWGLGVDYPKRVQSSGGRYHYQDDWEFPDTQVITFDFESRQSIMWEGRSCNGRSTEGQDRGVAFYGENGSVQVKGDGYTVYDLKGKVVKTVEEGPKDESGGSVLGPGDQFDAYHLGNFVDSIRNNTAPNGGIEEGHKSVTLCHLGNIAWRFGRAMNCDPTNGHILNDTEAMTLWGREYEKGWEPKV